MVLYVYLERSLFIRYIVTIQYKSQVYEIV